MKKYFSLEVPFWIIVAVFVALFFTPYILTAGNPSYDGVNIFGFPFAFFAQGGLCPSADNVGQICRSFIWRYLLIDIAVILGFSLGINSFFIWKKNKKV
jgi:hypothetical protein